MRQSLDAKQNEINALNEEKGRNAEVIKQREEKVKAEQTTITGITARIEQLHSQKEQLQKARSEELSHRLRLNEASAELKTQMKVRQDELNSLGKGKQKVARVIEGLKKKKQTGEHDMQRLQESRNAIRSEVAELTKTLESLKRQADLDSKTIADMLHERDILNKATITADEGLKQQVDLVKRHEAQADNMEKDLKRWKIELTTKCRFLEFKGREGGREGGREREREVTGQGEILYWALQEAWRTKGPMICHALF